MSTPILFVALLLIMAGALVLASGPFWITCLVAVLGGWWASSMLASVEREYIEERDEK